MLASIKRALVLKGIFYETTSACVCLHTKFQVSSIILTSFRQGVILPLSPTSKQTSKKPTQIRVKSNDNLQAHAKVWDNFWQLKAH